LVLEPVEERADEEEAEKEEGSEEPGSRPGRGKDGISDREEFRPANTCRANSVLVGGKGVRGDGLGEVAGGEW
jgi:hypothetical protein